ncbi:hypothetical protein ACHWQZ_G001198 [Mnemiopsis leidyi]
MSRVNSKNLFNFKPAGKLDDDIAAMYKKMEEGASNQEAKAVTDKMADLLGREDEEANKEYLEMFRSMCESMVLSMLSNPVLEGWEERVLTTSITVPTKHDGQFDVPVEVYTPKQLEGERMRAAYVYAHGGGAVAMSAAHMNKHLSKYAADNDLVVFNVDYRLAPETKCPNNIKDFYEAIKYVHTNAEALGINPGKICIAGESGGGYICLGAMVLLAENNESSMVKVAVPGIPMTDDYCFSDPLAMTVEERQQHLMMRKIWKHYIAADWEEQKHNPHLFPGKSSEELLERFPPTIMLEAEFDFYITEATRLAGRLRRAGRLLELVVIPGSPHGVGFFTGTKGCELQWTVMDTIAREYIHGEF